MNFQRRLAISPTSLHTVAVIVVIAWVVVGSASPLTHDCNMGLWHLLPGAVRHNGWVNQLLAIITMVVSVYTLHELNLSHVMLRINSRTISFVFAAVLVLFVQYVSSGIIGRQHIRCLPVSEHRCGLLSQVDMDGTHIHALHIYAASIESSQCQRSRFGHNRSVLGSRQYRLCSR